VNNNGETGKKCPNCGAEGRAWRGEHETAVRNYQVPGQTIVDVGWRCWNCGWEWGFELAKMLGESGLEQTEG